MRWPALFIAAFLLAPATASAQRVEDTFFNSVIPSRVDHLIGFTPTTFAIHPRGQRVVPITVRVGGRTLPVHLRQCRRGGGPVGRHLHEEHDPGAALPEPAGNLPRPPAQGRRASLRAGARGPRPRRRRAGRERRASRVCLGSVPCRRPRDRRGDDPHVVGGRRSDPGERGCDRVAPRRHRGRSLRGAPFRAGCRLPHGARAASDGGLSEAASGNLAIAAVTSWSRARTFQGTTCAVPVGGAAPSDASVRALSHPDAYPISFVTLRRLAKCGVARSSPPS